LQQQLLKDGCYIIDLPNSDPNDLALGAKVTASSFAPPAPLSARGGRKSHRLDCDRAVMFRVTQPQIRTVAVCLDSTSPSQIPVRLSLRGAAELADFRSTKDLAVAKAIVPAKTKGWVEFSFGVSVKPGYYYVFLPKTPGLSWLLFDVAPPETSRAYRSPGVWTAMPDCYQFRVDPPSGSEAAIAQRRRENPPETMFAPGNVVNGYARAIRGWPNSWRPEPGKKLPQWVELDFGRDVAFNCVHVSFQSRELGADAFRLEIPRGDGWQTVAQASDNRQRRRVIRFPAATAPRLRLVITGAKPEMGVCEIRVYHEPQGR